MLELNTAFLCTLEVDLNLGTIVGDTPLGRRVIVDVSGGRVTGPRFSGRVLPSGGDWLLVGTDGCARIDVRSSMELDDGAVVYATYGGRLNVPPEIARGGVRPRNRRDRGSRALLFPHRADLRDGLAEIRLAQPHPGDRRWTPDPRGSRLQPL